MKHLKSLCIAMAILAALSFVSCSKDDDSDTNGIDAKYIFGAWQEGTVDSGIESLSGATLYMFFPYSADYKTGGFAIHVYGITGGQKEYYSGSYTLSNAGILQTFITDENGKEQLHKKYNVIFLSFDEMVLAELDDGNKPCHTIKPCHTMQLKKRMDIDK